eukprot:4606055-Prymnesium_polylepis.1
MVVDARAVTCLYGVAIMLESVPRLDEAGKHMPGKFELWSGNFMLSERGPAYYGRHPYESVPSGCVRMLVCMWWCACVCDVDLAHVCVQVKHMVGSMLRCARAAAATSPPGH